MNKNELTEKFEQLIRPIFPADFNFKIGDPKSYLNFKITYPMPNNERPNRKSQYIIIKISEETQEDYLSKSELEKNIADKRIISFIQSKLKTFIPEAKHGLHQVKHEDEWLISTLIIGN